MITNRTELDIALNRFPDGQREEIFYDFLLNSIPFMERADLIAAGCLGYDGNINSYIIISNASYAQGITSCNPTVSTPTQEPETEPEPEKEVDYFDIVKDLCS